MSNYDDWKIRYEGFVHYAAQLSESINEALKELTDEEDVKALKDLKELTDALQDFTYQLFDFFLNGFSDFLGKESKEEEKSITLIPSAEYPPEYVLQRILQQASFDLTVIQRLVEQRKNTEISNLLKKYDQLALAALSIAFPDAANRETGLIEPVKPFVYFQRDTSVRIIPYANILLVGVPFSTSRQPVTIDLLSIPHEIGHHIYETGKLSKTEPINLLFEKYFAGEPVWIQNWLEEIFADLYGFLVAGPIVAFSLQEILLDNFPSSLWEDDGDHPAGIIRPLIYSELFNLPQFNNGGLEASKIAKKLAEKWDEESKKRGFAGQIRSVTENQVIDLNEAIKTIGRVLEQMYNIMNQKTQSAFDFPASLNLNKNLQPWTFFPTNAPSIPKDVQIDPGAPFLNFSVDKLIGSQTDKIAKMQQFLRPRVSKFEVSRKDKNMFWLTDQIGYWRKKANNEDLPLPPLEPDIWKLIFTAFSWAEQEPDSTRPV